MEYVLVIKKEEEERHKTDDGCAWGAVCSEKIPAQKRSHIIALIYRNCLEEVNTYRHSHGYQGLRGKD